MRNLVTLTIIVCAIVLVPAARVRAQGPQGRSFGFGLSLGDPLGGTIKYWTEANQAFVADIGGDYFGSPRLDIDYHWHFNAFRSSVVKLFVGPGVAFGFGQGRYYLWYGKGHDYYFIRNDGQTGIGARILLGINIIPRNTPIEFYLQAGPLIGISPSFGTSFDVAAGIRFYP